MSTSNVSPAGLLSATAVPAVEKTATTVLDAVNTLTCFTVAKLNIKIISRIIAIGLGIMAGV